MRLLLSFAILFVTKTIRGIQQLKRVRYLNGFRLRPNILAPLTFGAELNNPGAVSRDRTVSAMRGNRGFFSVEHIINANSIYGWHTDLSAIEVYSNANAFLHNNRGPIT